MHPHVELPGSWCCSISPGHSLAVALAPAAAAGEEAVSYHIKDEILVNSVSHHALDGVRQLERASKKLFAAGAASMQSFFLPLVMQRGEWRAYSSYIKQQMLTDSLAYMPRC